MQSSVTTAPETGPLLLYRGEQPQSSNYRITPLHVFSEAERCELESILSVRNSPYVNYPEFRDEVLGLVRRGAIPSYFLEICREIGRRDLRAQPVFQLKNCPIGEVPYLDFEDQRASKHAIKKSFVPEALLQLFAELRETPIVTYRTANAGDMFHDLHPVRALQYSMSQKSVNTLCFHTDLPDNRVRPDWVTLVALRNSPKNEVLNSFTRFSDVMASLDPAVIEVLKRPLFHSPRTKVERNISVYGAKDLGFLERRPVIAHDRGYECFFYNEDYQTSDSEEGLAALAEVCALTQKLRCSIFFEERDLLSICNNTCFHARHVVKIRDMEAHQNRWILKTWNVDDIELHRAHFVPGRINTADE